MRNRIFVLFLCLFFFKPSVFSQVLEPIRLEMPARYDAAPAYHIEVLGEKGVLVFYESTEIDEDGKRHWYFSLLDTELDEIWLQFLPLTDGLTFHSVQSSATHSVLLFASPAGKRAKDIYEIVRFDHENAAFAIMGGDLPEKAKIEGMAIVENQILLVIDLPKYTTDLLLFDFEQSNLKSLSHNIGGQTVLQYIGSSEQSNCFVLAFKHFENNRFVKDVFLTVSSAGKLLRSIDFKDDTYYLHALTVMMDHDDVVVAGSYDLQRRRASVRDAANEPEMTNEAKGMFFLRFLQDESFVSSYNDFDKFTNIYRTLSTEDLIRARNRMGRSKNEDKRQNIGFQFYNPQLIRLNDQYVYSAESFKPRYRLETRMDYDFYGRVVPYTYSIFEGYQFYSALIAAFDNNAELQWTTDMELRDMLLPRLTKNVNIMEDSSMLLVSMLQKGILTSKIITSDGKQLGQLEKAKVENTFTNDKLLNERNSSFLHWYGPYFIATGYQRISNNRLRSHNPRSVFYIQKMILE